MELKATVIKEYKAEFGAASGFDYDPGTLANIIGAYSSDSYLGGEGSWGLGYSMDSYWQIPREDFVEMLEGIREMPEEEFDRNMEEEWYEGGDEKPYSKGYVINALEGFLEETPEGERYVRLGWV